MADRRVRIAIAHDYLTQRGGAERVVLALARIFPDAPIYTTLFDADGTYPEFQALDVRTSWLNRFKVLRRDHRLALPLLPIASSTRRIDADVVIASSSGWAHGFPTDGLKIVYCYSPARWLYEPQRYLGANASPFVRGTLALLGPALRAWDRRAAKTADKYLAISTVTQGRIAKQYGIDAEILAAPHTVQVSETVEPKDAAALPPRGYFLVVSRLLPYKNVRQIVQAFARMPERHLLVVGTGPQKPELLNLSTENVTFLERLTDEEMQAAYDGCQALIAASHEDFGLTPLEAAAHGKPCAVLRWGGFLDTVVEGQTGIFFDEPDPVAIAEAVERVATLPWDAATLRARADEFSEENFGRALRATIYELTGKRNGY